MTRTLERCAAAARPVALAMLVGLMLAGCSFSIGGESPDDAAVELIEGDWSAQYGIPISGVTCVEPADEEVGTEFTCAANSDVGSIDYDVLIDREDHIVVTPTNLLLRVQVRAIAESSVDLLNDQAGAGLPAGSIDCGDQPIALGTPPEIVCALADPGSDDVYDTVITITDLEALSIDIQVADAPR